MIAIGSLPSGRCLSHATVNKEFRASEDEIPIGARLLDRAAMAERVGFEPTMRFREWPIFSRLA
jgi:hypothetical protein